MKRNKALFTFCSVLALVVSLLSCGGDPAHASQVGIALYDQPVIHGHSGPIDGGVLNSPTFSAYNSSTLVVTSGVATKVRLNMKDVDTGNAFDTTNYRHIAKVQGNYLYTAIFCGGSSTSTTDINTVFYKNGSAYSLYSYMNGISGTGAKCISLTWMTHMNGTTDYVELFGTVTGTGTSQITYCSLQGILISR